MTKRRAYLAMLIEGIVYLILIILGVVLTLGSDVMGYDLIVFFMLLPVLNLVCGMFYGKAWRYRALWLILPAGLLTYLAYGVTFHNWSFDWLHIALGAIPLAVGVMFGDYFQKKKQPQACAKVFINVREDEQKSS